MEGRDPSGRIHDIRVYRPSFVGMVVLVCALFLVVGSSSVYGTGRTVALGGGWVVLFALGCRWFMSNPWRVVVVGALSVLAWLVVVLLAG